MFCDLWNFLNFTKPLNRFIKKIDFNTSHLLTTYIAKMCIQVKTCINGVLTYSSIEIIDIIIMVFSLAILTDTKESWTWSVSSVDGGVVEAEVDAVGEVVVVLVGFFT